MRLLVQPGTESRCVSSPHLPRSPALSVLVVPASQASSRVDVRPRSRCSAAARRAGARRGSAEEPVRLLSPRACRCIAGRPAMDTAWPLAVLRVHVLWIVLRRARLQCMTMCRIGVVRVCVCGLERGWCGRNVHRVGIPVRPSCLYIISTICNRLGACAAVRDVVRPRNSKNVRRRSTYVWTTPTGTRLNRRSSSLLQTIQSVTLRTASARWLTPLVPSFRLFVICVRGSGLAVYYLRPVEH